MSGPVSGRPGSGSGAKSASASVRKPPGGGRGRGRSTVHGGPHSDNRTPWWFQQDQERRQCGRGRGLGVGTGARHSQVNIQTVFPRTITTRYKILSDI